MYYDLKSGNEIEEKVPKGKFRVVYGDSFDRESRGIFGGDFDTLTLARAKKEEILLKESGSFTKACIFDDQGRLVD